MFFNRGAVEKPEPRAPFYLGTRPITAKPNTGVWLIRRMSGLHSLTPAATRRAYKGRHPHAHLPDRAQPDNEPAVNLHANGEGKLPFMRSILLALGITFTLGLPAPASAQAREEPFWPGASYDPAIPTVRQVLGHDPGRRSPRPNRSAIPPGAPEGRADPHAPLRIRPVLGGPPALADGHRQSRAHRPPRRRSRRPAEARRPARRAAGRAGPPGKGSRRSSSGSPTASTATRSRRRTRPLLEAYHLLAAQGDADVDAVLRDALVLIDPMQNPDGRARFVFQNLQGRAAGPDPTPYNAEHDEPWPGGRSNHYLFDMNRDWFAQTQPETRGRIQVARDYWPHVNVDLHEQGGDNTYYFAPPADPLNPHITKSQIAGVRPVRARQRPALRRARLAVLHPRGVRLVLSGIRRIVADLPGLDRHDLRAGLGPGPVVRAERRHHCSPTATASCTTSMPPIVTAVTAAKNRERLVRDFLEYRKSAVAEGEKGPGARIRARARPRSVSRRSAGQNLATQGIEVRRATEPMKVGTARCRPAPIWCRTPSPRAG